MTVEAERSAAPGTALAETKFRNMSSTQKLQFAGKVVLFVITFGFVFPTLLTD